MILPISDALAKRLAARYPIAEIAAIRYAVHFLAVCAAALAYRGTGALQTQRVFPHTPARRVA